MAHFGKMQAVTTNNAMPISNGVAAHTFHQVLRV